MTLNKKSLAMTLILSVAMLFTMIPASAYAESVNYNLWIGNTRVSSDVTSGEGWSYDGDANSGTLTLNGANITDSHIFNSIAHPQLAANIMSDDIDLTIKLEGENTLKGLDPNLRVRGLEIRGPKLTITGTGSLDIEANEYGIYCDEINLDGVDITINSNDDCLVVNGAGDAAINGGKLVFTGTDSDGIDCGKLTIANADMTLNARNYGCNTDGIDITDSILTLETAEYSAIYSDTNAITIGNSEVTATCSSAVPIKGYSDADLIITDSKVTATSTRSSMALDANTIEFKSNGGKRELYVEASTGRDENPAVFADNGITLGDDVEIVEPENGSVGAYESGTAILNEDGSKAAKVVIKGPEKPEPEPEPAPAPAPAPEVKPAPVISNDPLLAQMKSRGKTSLELKWNPISGAEGYDVFFSRCNSGDEKRVTQLVATLNGADQVTWTASGLQAKKPYKACVKAWILQNGSKTYVKTSPMLHAYTSGGTAKFTNAKSVKVKKSKVTLRTGKKYKIKATVTKQKKSKRLMSASHAAQIRYLSTDPSVAKVSSKGRITATGQGSCIIYVYAQNGVYKKVTVTIK